jgi:E3 ubiquitin-protein ligase UBR3
MCLYPSIYLDAHGEEDEFLKRGRPLFLDRERYAALSELWAHGALDYDTLALHTSKVGSDFY